MANGFYTPTTTGYLLHINAKNCDANGRVFLPMLLLLFIRGYLNIMKILLTTLGLIFASTSFAGAVELISHSNSVTLADTYEIGGGKGERAKPICEVLGKRC